MSQSEHSQQTDCAQVVLRLFEYVDHEAAEEDGVRIREHLDACGSCLREYERDLLLKEMVKRACSSEAAPAALRTQIMARISTITITEHLGDGRA
ncbi:mycothiol system anti-sigma-R factor [Ornithinimicrobium faecis]|uniref:Mycothiol system anti-sigma-R factor n=1 Tax=Ornithinimicrobium faecis TaxID=2934158 RepID=A0ABY4YRC3_9MICO|nr:MULTISPECIES: mycothiol system anti-sigma-R factor [unclassified Ornithinimicrobium]USQ78830.1 mycothiol system anti-sigma-R factor [Ornithinimicrobium sp. HY1793]